jgi:hypothetical protein
MVLFLLITLALSAAGLGLLIGVKQWELASGRVIFASYRPAFARRSRRIIFWVERVLPAIVAYWAERSWRASLAYVHASLARGIVAAENMLERALLFVRHKTSTPPQAPREQEDRVTPP